MSLKQLKDLETVKYFIPEILKVPITKEDEEAYFKWSEEGVESKSVGFKALKEGKRYRGIHMEMYEQGVLEGSVPYFTLLEKMPKSVVEFMKKEMFKGQDANLIQKVYESAFN